MSFNCNFLVIYGEIVMVTSTSVMCILIVEAYGASELFWSFFELIEAFSVRTEDGKINFQPPSTF